MVVGVDGCPDRTVKICAFYAVEAQEVSRAVVDHHQMLPGLVRMLRPSRGVSSQSGPRYEYEPSLLCGLARVLMVQCVLCK